MKYVRTKDGKIYEKSKVFVVKENDVEIVLLGITDDFIERTRGKTWNCGTNVIIKQADEIAELCDEFVFIDEFFKREHRLAFSLENALARCKYHDVDITTLRGAIWTDKGLIYVAKMNEKGELELL